MKLALIAATGLLHVWFSEAFTLEDAAPSVRIHPRALTKRDGRDCGKFVMFCEKAAAACNNACYHINCVDSTSATMVYGTSTWFGTPYVSLTVAEYPGTMPAITMITTVFNLAARPQTAAFATPCHSVKSSTIH